MATDDTIADWKAWHRKVADALGCTVVFVERSVTLLAVQNVVQQLATLRADVGRLTAERDAARAEVERLRVALEPSGDTKAAYMGEFEFGVYDGVSTSGQEQFRTVTVPWVTIKDIMAAIRKYAAALDPLSAPAKPICPTCGGCICGGCNGCECLAGDVREE